MGIRFTQEFVKDSYSNNSIKLIGNYRNLYKKVKLECELCEYTWEELFSQDRDLFCPKCKSIKTSSFAEVEKTDSKKRSGRRKKT